MVRDAFFTPRARCAFVYGVYGTYTCAGSVTVLSKRYVLLMVSWHCTVQRWFTQTRVLIRFHDLCVCRAVCVPCVPAGRAMPPSLRRPHPTPPCRLCVGEQLNMSTCLLFGDTVVTKKRTQPHCRLLARLCWCPNAPSIDALIALHLIGNGCGISQDGWCLWRQAPSKTWTAHCAINVWRQSSGSSQSKVAQQRVFCACADVHAIFTRCGHRCFSTTGCK